MATWRFSISVRNDSSSISDLVFAGFISTEVTGSGSTVSPGAGTVNTLQMKVASFSPGEIRDVSWDFPESDTGTYYAIAQVFDANSSGGAPPVAGGYSQFLVGMTPGVFSAEIEGVWLMNSTFDVRPGETVTFDIDATNTTVDDGTAPSRASHTFGLVIHLKDSLGRTWNTSSRVPRAESVVLDPSFCGETDQVLIYPGAHVTANDLSIKIPDDFPVGETEYWATIWTYNTAPPTELLGESNRGAVFTVSPHVFTSTMNEDYSILLDNGSGVNRVQTVEIDPDRRVRIWTSFSPDPYYATDLGIRVNYQNIDCDGDYSTWPDTYPLYLKMEVVVGNTVASAVKRVLWNKFNQGVVDSVIIPIADLSQFSGPLNVYVDLYSEAGLSDASHVVGSSISIP